MRAMNALNLFQPTIFHHLTDRTDCKQARVDAASWFRRSSDPHPLWKRSAKEAWRNAYALIAGEYRGVNTGFRWETVLDAVISYL